MPGIPLPVLSSVNLSDPRWPITLSAGAKFIMRFRVYVKVKIMGMNWKPCILAKPDGWDHQAEAITAVRLLACFGAPITWDVKK